MKFRNKIYPAFLFPFSIFQGLLPSPLTILVFDRVFEVFRFYTSTSRLRFVLYQIHIHGMCVYVCVCVCVLACMRAYVRVCVCVLLQLQLSMDSGVCG